MSSRHPNSRPLLLSFELVHSHPHCAPSPPRFSPIASPMQSSTSSVLDDELSPIQNLPMQQTTTSFPQDEQTATPSKRSVCSHCKRPLSVCLCSYLPEQPLPTQTPIIILQTSAESRAKVGTGHLPPLVLSSCTLHPASQSPTIPPDAILLFPGQDAAPLSQVFEPHRTLVFLDATWDAAKRLYLRTPTLQALQRAYIPLTNLGDVLFRVRKPPTDRIRGARSTAEAVAAALECIEGTPSEAVTMLRRVVYEMSEQQLQFARAKNSVKHRKERYGYEQDFYR